MMSGDKEHSIHNVTRRHGTSRFLDILSRKTFSGRTYVLVIFFKNINQNSLVGIIWAKIMHIYKLSLGSQGLSDYREQDGKG